MLKALIAAIVLCSVAFSISAAPLRVKAKEQKKKLVRKVTPQYPAQAKAQRIQGIVKFEALIGTDGTVKELKVLSGPDELVPATLQAVKQWVYKPTLLNGEPTEVITEIEVTYMLVE